MLYKQHGGKRPFGLLACVALATAIMLTAAVPSLATADHAAVKVRQTTEQGDLSYLQENTWYLAEGYTGGDFNTWVLLQNPGMETANVTMQFQLPAGPTASPLSFTMPGGTRQSILLNNVPGLSNTEVSTIVTSDQSIYVQRSAYFSYYGWTGGTSSIGADSTNFDWYFAEGYTGQEFDTYILVQNPEDSAADVTLEFGLPGGSTADPYVMEVPPLSRRTVKLNDLPGLASSEVSTHLKSAQPVVAERVMYFDYHGIDGGHSSIGLTSTDQEYYAAEGYTGPGFDTYFLVFNPGDDDAEATFEFQTPQGSVPSFQIGVPAHTRKTVRLNDLPGLSSTDVSTMITSDQLIVAERSMYFDHDGYNDGHCSNASDSISDTWELPEGCTRAGFETWILLQNLADNDVQATLEFQFPTAGYSYSPYSVVVPAHGRATVGLQGLNGFPQTDVSTTVTADAPLVAESALYFDYKGITGGSVSLGHIPNTLMPNALILDPDSAALISSITDNSVTLGGMNDLLASIGVGDVVEAPSCAAAPNGFLRTVTGVQQVGGSAVFSTVQAEINDLLRYGSFSGGSDSSQLSSAGSVSSSYSYDLFGYGTIWGESSLDIGIKVAIHVKYKWKIIPIGVTMKVMANEGQSLGIGMSATKDLNLSTQFKIKTFNLEPFWAGPLLFFPKINLYVGLAGNAAAGTSLSWSGSVSEDAGFGCDDGWYTYSDFNHSMSSSINLPQAAMGLKVYTREEAECMLYDVIGPTISFQEYVRAQATPGSTPWWGLYLGVQFDGGVDLFVLIKHFRWYGTIFNKEWKIAP